MQTARKYLDILRDFLPMSGSRPVVLVTKEALDGFESEIDQADADAAFRAVVQELAVKNGMDPTQNLYYWLQRGLTKGSEVEAVLMAYGYERGENPALFLKSKFKQLAREVDTNKSLRKMLQEAEEGLASTTTLAEKFVRDDAVVDVLTKEIQSAKEELKRFAKDRSGDASYERLVNHEQLTSTVKRSTIFAIVVAHVLTAILIAAL